MNDIIVQTSENITLLGAGQASKAQLTAALRIAPYLIAADGGAQMALNCGMTPKNVIGDFDSIDSAVLAKIPEHRRHHVAEQQSTDFEKCLARIRAPLILGVGFLGRRLDHQLAALNALVRHRGAPCVLIGKHDLVFHLHGALHLSLEAGTRLSLFALAAVTGVSRGLDWPVDRVAFAPDGKTGCSNRVSNGQVSLEFAEPGMLVILPGTTLAAVVPALLGK